MSCMSHKTTTTYSLEVLLLSTDCMLAPGIMNNISVINILHLNCILLLLLCIVMRPMNEKNVIHHGK